MKIFIFDTETTGLPPRNQKPNKQNVRYWPNVVQYSSLVYDTDDKTFKTDDFIVKIPEHKTIPQESIDIHGITNEIMRKKGTNVKTVLDNFIENYNTSDIIVAHNIGFDYNLMLTELIRNKMDEQIDIKKVKFCTMDNTKEMCNIRVKNTRTNKIYVKWPTLNELHKHLFKTEPENLHNSLIDVYVCFRCFYRLRFGKDIFEDRTNPSSEIYYELTGL